MLAARYYGINDIRVEEIPTPSIPRRGGLVKVYACGICGTDKRIYANGHFRINPGEARVLGHEIIAEIVGLDRKDEKFKLGDRVTFAPNVGCGTCQMCKKGFTQLCDNFEAFGISMDGGFAQYMAVPKVAFTQGNLFKVPDELSRDEGAMVEICACAYRGLSACNLSIGETLLIIGGGTVTYLMCGFGRAMGASKILVSVIDDGWGELSKRGNPDMVINSRKVDLKDAVLKETDGLGADVVIVACSAKEMDELAPDLAAVQGRVNFFGGLPVDKSMVTINSRAIHYREVTVLGTTGANPTWIERTLELLRTKPFNLETAITNRYELKDICQAFDEPDTTPRFKSLIYCN